MDYAQYPEDVKYEASGLFGREIADRMLNREGHHENYEQDAIAIASCALCRVIVLERQLGLVAEGEQDAEPVACS